MEPVEAFAANVRRLRAEKELTQEKLAERSDLRLSDIAKIETLRRSPGILVIAKIAHGLGIPAAELMADVEYRGSQNAET